MTNYCSDKKSHTHWCKHIFLIKILSVFYFKTHSKLNINIFLKIGFVLLESKMSFLQTSYKWKFPMQSILLCQGPFIIFYVWQNVNNFEKPWPKECVEAPNLWALSMWSLNVSLAGRILWETQPTHIGAI